MLGFNFVKCIFVRDIKVRDTQCGFKLFSREAAKRIFPSQHLRRWCFDIEILFIAYKTGIVVSEVPIK